MSWNTMEPFGWLLLALVLAVVADVVLIRLWQRHQALRRRSPERRGAADGDGDGPEEPAAPGGPEPLPPGVHRRLVEIEAEASKTLTSSPAPGGHTEK